MKSQAPDITQAKARYYLAMLITSLPYGLGKDILQHQNIPEEEKAWFSYSSMPIAMNHLKICGYKIIQYTSILRPGFKGSCGVVAGSVGANCQFGMVADPSLQPEELLQLI